MKIKQRYIYPLLMGMLILIFYFYEEGFFRTKKQIPPGATSNAIFYLPTSTTNQIVYHDFYALSYSEPHEQAEWVAYELKKNHLSDADRDRPYFNEDPKVGTGSADWRNYKNSGYDRGHLCPAGDRRFSIEAYNETFYTSNVSPMLRGFNGGIWNKLEIQTRNWAYMYNGVYVVTGGILTKSEKAIGYEGVTVPSYFYKIVLNNRKGVFRLIAFLLPHEESNRPLEDYVVSVDTIEEMTGIDFFYNLPDDQEEPAESTIRIEDWNM